MEVYDKNNEKLHSILLSEGSSGSSFETIIGSYLDAKIESVELAGKKVNGALLQSYLASMLHGSVKSMDAVVARGFNPSYHLLYKHHTLLMEYLQTAEYLDRKVVAQHIRHLKSIHKEQPESVQLEKVRDYLNVTAPYNLHDAVSILAKRSPANGYKDAEKELIDIIKIISSYGASLNGLDRSNYSALHWALIEGNSKVALHLIRNLEPGSCCAYNDNGESAMFLASKNGNLDVVTALLVKGVSVNGYHLKSVADPVVSTTMRSKLQANNPLLHALKTENTKIALPLVRNGANFDGVNNPHDFHTPLIYAAKLKDFELQSEMLKRGFDQNESNSHGFTPLLYLIKSYEIDPLNSQTTEMINGLLAKGASFDVISKSGICGTDVLIKLSRSGDSRCQDWLFDRNVKKMKDFVKTSVGLELTKINDLVINDENLADMRLNRVEEVNSVWLNRGAKTTEYKKSLSDKGLSELKKIFGLVSAVSGGSYAALEFAVDKLPSYPSIGKLEAVQLMTHNTLVTSAVLTTIATIVGSMDLIQDKSKRYAVINWCNDILSKVDGAVVQPVVDFWHRNYNSSALAISGKIARIVDCLQSIRERLSLALDALQGNVKRESVYSTPANEDLGNPSKITDLQEARSSLPRDSNDSNFIERNGP